MKTKQYFGTTTLLGHIAVLPGPVQIHLLDSSQKQMLWIRLHKTFLVHAFMCFSTLRTFLTYQIPVLLQVIKKHTFFFSFGQGDQL